MENTSSNTPNTEWKATKNPESNNPKYVEFRDIFTHSHSYTQRYKALKEFDKYDCRQSRDYVKHIAKTDECFDVRLLAHSLCYNKFDWKFKFAKPRTIDKIPQYQSIIKSIKTVFNIMNIITVDQLDDKYTWIEFNKIFCDKYKREYDLFLSKLPFDNNKKARRDFIKSQYLALFTKKQNEFDKKVIDPKFTEFQSLINGENDVHKCLAVLDKFKESYNCRLSRDLLKKITQAHEYTIVRRKAIELCHSLSLPTKSLQIPKGIRNHEIYKDFPTHFKEIIEELNINIVQEIHEKREEFSKLFVERYPLDMLIIVGKLTQPRNKDTKLALKRFWEHEFYSIYPDRKPVKIKKVKQD